MSFTPRLRAVRRSLPLLAASLVGLVAAPDASATLQLGASGRAVERLNARLAALTYLPAGHVGSRFTHATRYAVMAFQKYARIEVDGVVGPVTGSALRSALRPRAPAAGAGRRLVVSLSRQLAFLVGSGGLVRRTVSVSTGKAGYRTPRGSFRVYRRERRSWSYPYRVWLPWAAYFHGGYALHGYRSVPSYPASHGCVRVPLPFAGGVYAFATLGTKVVVT
jgi:N-acetylmuramoyl-L-alanine amidase